MKTELANYLNQETEKLKLEQKQLSLARNAWEDSKNAMAIYMEAGGKALNMVEIATQCVELDKACGELLAHATAMAQQLPGSVEAFLKRDHSPTEKWGQASLYSAAGDLLKALTLTVNQLELMCPARDGNLRQVLAPCFDQAKAAIAKATGGK